MKEVKKAYADLSIGFTEQTLQGINELESYDMISIRRKSNAMNKKKIGDLQSKIVLKIGLSEIEAGIAENQLLSKYYL